MKAHIDKIDKIIKDNNKKNLDEVIEDIAWVEDNE